LVIHLLHLLLLLLLLLKSVDFDDDVALLLSVAGLVMGPHVTSESITTSEIAFCYTFTV